MWASACASSGKADGGTGRLPTQKIKTGGGEWGPGEQPTATKPPASTTRGAQTPHLESTEDRTPKRGTGGPPSQNRQHQARNSGPPGKGTPKQADTHHTGKKKEPAAQPERKGMGGQGPQGPGQGQPATDSTKPNQDRPKKRAQKAHPDNPTRKGGVQPRPGPSKHAHTPHPSQERQGTTHPRTATPTRRCRRPRRTGAQAHTHPNTPPRRGGVQPKPKPQHAGPHRTPEPETAGGKRSAHATTHVS